METKALPLPKEVVLLEVDRSGLPPASETLTGGIEWCVERIRKNIVGLSGKENPDPETARKTLSLMKERYPKPTARLLEMLEQFLSQYIRYKYLVEPKLHIRSGCYERVVVKGSKALSRTYAKLLTEFDMGVLKELDRLEKDFEAYVENITEY